jgi:HSP20 family protein
MHTIVHPLSSMSRKTSAVRTSKETFRQPAYDCHELPDAMKLVVYVPNVSASGVEIEGRGADLTVTARKQQFVRVNWQALHLEGAQRDYQLRLRLGAGFDYAAMEAEIHDGILTITLPKRMTETARHRRVA